MDHAQYVQLLNGQIGEIIVRQFCNLSPTIRVKYHDMHVNYWCLKEFVVRFDKGLVLPDGRFERCNRYFDAVLLVEPSLNAIAQKWSFKIGVEVKGNKKDLLNDIKLPYYLGWTDFFVLAVPDELIEDAIKKASGDTRIGIVSLTSGIIHKMPSWQDVTIGRRYEVMEQAFFNYMKKDVPVCSFNM